MEQKKIFSYAGIIGPVFYFTILTILGLVWRGYNPITTGMSEIGAIDAPFRNIMNYFGFSLLGISIVIFSFSFRYWKDTQSKIARIFLMIGGLFMFLVGFFPCDPNCIDVTTIGKIHSLTSTIPAIIIPISAMTFALPISKKFGKKWGYLSFYLGLFSMGAGPAMFIFENYTGLIQRIGIGLSMLWILLIATKTR